jgi:hypothetical protein
MLNRVNPALALTAALWNLAAQPAPRIEPADVQRLAGSL